jgi:phosphoserine phosphatase RsbU/P
VDRLHELFDAAPCGILEFDCQGKISAANAQLLQILGYSAGELESKNFDDLLTVSSRIFHQTHFFPMLKLHGHAEEVYFTLRDKQDKAIPMLTNASLRGDGLGARTVCAFMPVHQRKKYEDEILLARRQAEEALNSNQELTRSRSELESRLRELDHNLAMVERRNEELLRLNQIMSHDLREPVRKIEAFLGVLLEENRQILNEEGLIAAGRIKAACDRMQNLLQTLQEFFWIDTSNEALALVNLNEVLAASIASAGRPHVSAVDLPTVQGYPGQLQTLFERLLRSAILRAGDGPAAIDIGCTIVQQNTFKRFADKYRYADFAQIIVHDNGKPFDCDHCQSLFQLLRKSTEADSHPDLAICQRIIDNHHGSISLQSGREQGATFKFLLPMRLAELTSQSDGASK